MAYTNINTYLAAQTSNYTLVGYEDLVEMNATSGALIVTMCSAAVVVVGKLFTIKKTDSSTNTITINPVLSQTFDYRSVITLRQDGDYVVLKSDGVNWQIVSKKETEVMTGSNSASTGNSIASGTYFATSATITLTPGTWRISAAFSFSSGTVGVSSFCSIQSGTGVYAAAGTGTTVAPTSLTNPIGPPTIGFGGGLQIGGSTSNGPNLETSLTPFLLTVTANTSIYAVAQVQYINGTNPGQIYTQVTAERAW